MPPYENTSPDANYATESRHHGTPITAQTCRYHHRHDLGKE
jgi:hypothetical protein